MILSHETQSDTLHGCRLWVISISRRNGAHIKPHQEEGLQFLWREITAEHEDLQVCLLAQTMGLDEHNPYSLSWEDWCTWKAPRTFEICCRQVCCAAWTPWSWRCRYGPFKKPSTTQSHDHATHEWDTGHAACYASCRTRNAKFDPRKSINDRNSCNDRYAKSRHEWASAIYTPVI